MSQEKVEHMLAAFVKRADKPLSHPKLMSLCYLADRESIRQTFNPISGDSFIATLAYPVLLNTMMKMMDSPDKQDWGPMLINQSDYFLAKSHEYDDHDLYLLSEADLAIIDGVWKKHGHEREGKLAAYVRENCPEWVAARQRDMESSDNVIRFDDFYKAFGWTSQDVSSNVKPITDAKLKRSAPGLSIGK